jgi:hypothetical protein
MKLENAEVLLLSQILFQVKSLPNQNWEASEQINLLYSKLCNHLVTSLSQQSENESDVDFLKTDYLHDELRAWQESESDEHDSCGLAEELDSLDIDGVNHLKLSTGVLVELEPLRVDYKGKRSMIFESGISKSSLDINFDDGDEILCDVTAIERFADKLKIYCAEGCVFFDVAKFPKTWTSLLQTKTCYKVMYT